jgi:hypothetical protein
MGNAGIIAFCSKKVNKGGVLAARPDVRHGMIWTAYGFMPQT